MEYNITFCENVIVIYRRIIPQEFPIALYLSVLHRIRYHATLTA
jgi:hypothetical protein